MESKYDRFLRLKSTLRLMQDDQMMINHLADELVSAETDLTESLNAKNLVDSEIVAAEKKHNIRAKDLPKKLKQEKNRIFMEFRNNQNIVSKKHPKLKGLTWEEYAKDITENPSRLSLCVKLFSMVLLSYFLMLILDSRVNNIDEHTMNPFSGDFWQFCFTFSGYVAMFSLIALAILMLLPVTNAETKYYVDKMIKKHKDIETTTMSAKSKISKLEDAKKQIVKQLERLKQVLSVQSELKKKIEALGEKITDSAEQMIKLQTDVSRNWDSITDLIPSDSTMMFPKQLND